ncbi:multiple sugar transport system permease protein/raffinose/stachyose/melibiose transport system permease protein [Kribbella aluminosa]|uniref:Multiple sugar transport system permease protein/raffinose/stachyose/melibiose transport system permease protein n=1 Tax=Kribbella aluminosa TaxID=416017 RepID=A0ABS4UIE2_9ACTN|nr:sugar ABC transporter permease [Kribbella aluminosa]MBP2351426.1 multiple sugar transport system permease protein/raffinose/stachyose/melibiose transport system permease protein [Kribbella aluminosa]
MPSLALIVVFFIIPFVFNAGFAFSDWTSFSDAIAFNGLDNFRLITDLGILGHAIEVTVIYALVVVVVQNVVSLGLATLLQTPSRRTTFFRTLFFLPVLISPLAAGYIWSAMLRPNGPVNSAISVLVPGHFDYAWLGNATSALICTAAIEAWKWSGLATLVYVAGLNSVPRPIIEAATMDGAAGWTRFWRIKVPLLIPAFTFNLVIGFVGTLSAFDVIMATTSGGPGNATTVLNVALFQQYGLGFFGNASALSLVVTTLVVATAVPLVAFMRRREVAL